MSKDAAIWCDRGRQSGAPCLSGTRMPTATVARWVWSFGVDMALKAYPHLTRTQVFEACWFEAVNGRQRRRGWGRWAEQVRGMNWGDDCAALPEPPQESVTSE